MRLINARSLEVEEFVDNQIPKYAILSHRWGEGEVTFQDMSTPAAMKKRGYIKIEKAASQAQEDGLDFVWIDTCCIDKTSSAELSEAINSMMSWYEKSERCYAYLADVQSDTSEDELEAFFANSSWFTRGWTLQELLAPSYLVFYSSDWSMIGTRNDWADRVSRITSIDRRFLSDLQTASTESDTADDCIDSPISPNAHKIQIPRLKTRLMEASVAERMIWASRRETTRVEDKAYCLMGIFDVNMPLLYGEGDKAFFRLQQEIMKTSDDQSILAWSPEGFETQELNRGPRCQDWFDESAQVKEYSGILAISPSLFANCRDIVRFNDGRFAPPFSITNKGLSIELQLGDSLEYPYAVLQCQNKNDPANILAVPLKRTREGTFIRPNLPLVTYQSSLEWQRSLLYAVPHGSLPAQSNVSRTYTVAFGEIPEHLSRENLWASTGSSVRHPTIMVGDDRRVVKERAAILFRSSCPDEPRLIVLLAVERAKGTWRSAKQILSHFTEDHDWDLVEHLGQREPRYFDLEDWWRSLHTFVTPTPTVAYTSRGRYSLDITREDRLHTTCFIVNVRFEAEDWNITSIGPALRDAVRDSSRTYLAGCTGLQRGFWLVVLAPRILNVAVEFLFVKEAA
ncbi:HET domain-containing protein [Fusarium sp. LHS14.1]|nr:HET domain-containing protein [Fusarium sp. LHS14.1]